MIFLLVILAIVFSVVCVELLSCVLFEPHPNKKPCSPLPPEIKPSAPQKPVINEDALYVELWRAFVQMEMDYAEIDAAALDSEMEIYRILAENYVKNRAEK